MQRQSAECINIPIISHPTEDQWVLMHRQCIAVTNIKYNQMLAQMSIVGIGVHSAELGVAVICDKLKGMTKQDLERDWDAYPIGLSVPSGSWCASIAPTLYVALFPGHLLSIF